MTIFTDVIKLHHPYLRVDFEVKMNLTAAETYFLMRIYIVLRCPYEKYNVRR